MNKFNKLLTLLKMLNTDFDVIILTEVKLKDSAPFQLYSISGFDRIECVRNDQTRGGGGVIAFIKTGILSKYSKSNNPNFESLEISIRVAEIDFRLLVYYRTPVNNNIDDFLGDVEQKLSSCNINTILLGDINISSTKSDNNSAKYLDLIASYGYYVTNVYKTRCASGKVIDHVVANFYSSLNISNDTLEVDKTFSDHNIIITTISLYRKMNRTK